MNAPIRPPRRLVARRNLPPVPQFLRAPEPDHTGRLASARASYLPLATLSEQLLEAALAQVEPQPGRPAVTAGELLELAETLREAVADLGRVLHGGNA